MKLWVDDKRLPPMGYRAAKSAQEALGYLAHHEVTHLSLDYDLGKNKGLAVLANARHLPPSITLHTARPYGRKQMGDWLLKRGYRKNGNAYELPQPKERPRHG